MNSERIEEIQKETAYPDSISVQQALLKVWNECKQEKQQPKIITNEENTDKGFGDCSMLEKKLKEANEKVTDEEIELYAIQHILSEDSPAGFSRMKYWIEGAKWMRDKSVPVVSKRSELFFKFIDKYYSHSSENYRKELKNSFAEYLKNCS